MDEDLSIIFNSEDTKIAVKFFKTFNYSFGEVPTLYWNVFENLGH